MIHLNLGSNLNSKFGDRFDNIIKTIKLLSGEKVFIKKPLIFTKLHHTLTDHYQNLLI